MGIAPINGQKIHGFAWGQKTLIGVTTPLLTRSGAQLVGLQSHHFEPLWESKGTPPMPPPPQEIRHY